MVRSRFPNRNALSLLVRLLSAVAVIGFTQMKEDGETGAAVDAELLEGCVRRLLSVEDGG